MSNDRELQQVPLIDRVTSTPADFIFEGPSDEDLERIIEHDNGDFTLRGPGGELRLTKATPTWKRHRGYLEDSRIRPVPEVVVRYIYADRSTRELLDLPPRPESKYREQERAYADSPHRLDDPETTCEGYQPWSTLTEDEWNHLEALYDSGPYLAGDPGSHNEAMRLSEGATFHIADARERYFDLVAFDAVTAANMVAISGPARAMKLNVTVQDKLKNINCPTLIIHGREDFIVAAAPELVHRLVPNSQLVVIPHSGHYPFIEQPDTFSETLRRFITGTASTN